MKNLTIALGLLLISLIPIQATETVPENKTSIKHKVSTNFVNLIAMGDLNLNYEFQIKPKNAILFGVHKNPENKTQGLTGKSGAFVGYRIYPELVNVQPGISGDFIQFNLGLNDETDQTATSLELWFGNAMDMGTDLHLEVAAGIGRKYKEDAKVFVMAGINLAYKF